MTLGHMMLPYLMLRGHQYLYYVKHRPVISDEQFDLMENRYLREGGDPLPVGSDMDSSYTDDERRMARILSGR